MGVALGIIGTVASVAGGVVGAIGAMGQAAAARKSAEATAQAYRYQANVSRMNAALSAQQSSAAQDAQQLKAAAGKARMLALASASGVDVGSGSFDNVLKSSDRLSSQDALTIRSNYARQIMGYQTQGELEDMGAKGADVQAKLASQAGVLNAASSLLGGFSSAWSNYQKLQTFGGLNFGGGTDAYNPAKAAFGI